MRIVIIGAGECGVRAAFALRDRGFDGEILLLGEEKELPYERPPLSKDLSAYRKLIRNVEAFGEAGIDLRVAHEVQAILPEQRQVVVGEARISFDKLLIAAGARPRQIPELLGLPRASHGAI